MVSSGGLLNGVWVPMTSKPVKPEGPHVESMPVTSLPDPYGFKRETRERGAADFVGVQHASARRNLMSGKGLWSNLLVHSDTLHATGRAPCWPTAHWRRVSSPH